MSAAPTAGASPSPARSIVRCDARSYVQRVRNVTTEHHATIVSSRVVTYPGPTTIRRYQKVTTDWQINVRAGLGAHFTETVGGGISLGKIINASDSTSFGFNVRMQAGWNTNKSTTVVNDVTIKIPAAHSVVWFAGFQTLRGTFAYSTCEHMPPGDGTGWWKGTVLWHRSSWHSFSTVRESGGQRCDKPAESFVSRVAKRQLCS